MFLARVTPEADDRQVGPLRPQTVTFDVIEDFKGTAGSGAILTFDPAAADARVFSAGETVLVALRQLQAGSRGASLEGTLHIPASSRPPAAARAADLGNLPLSLQAMDGSDTIVLASQPSGYFLFRGAQSFCSRSSPRATSIVTR